MAGAGPVGLTAAIELARRGIACRIVVLRDRLESLGVRVERGVRLSTFEQDAEG